MKLRLRARNQVPPGGSYVMADPDTGKVIQAPNFNLLVSLSTDHRLSNKLAVPGDWEVEVEHMVCRRLCDLGHADWCEHADKPFVPVAPKLTLRLADVIRGTRTIASNVLAGYPVVDQNEAERRAAVCVACSFNVDAGDCLGCRAAKMMETIISIVGNASTTRDAALKSCYWCGCFNRVQVHFPLERLQRYLGSDLNLKLPDHCWKKTG